MSFCPRSGLWGIAEDECGSVIGGIKKLYFTIYKEGFFKYDEDKVHDQPVPKEIPTIVSGFNETLIEDDAWKTIEIRRNTSSMETEAVFNDDGFAVYFDNRINLVVKRMDATSRVALETLSRAKTMCICIDNNNVWWVLGSSSPMVSTSGGAESGTNTTDSNEYTLTLTAQEKVMAIPMSDDAIAKFKEIYGDWLTI